MYKSPDINYQVTQYYKPLVHFSSSTSTRMWMVSFCSFLVILQSSLSDSFYSLILALTVTLAAFLTEFFILYFKNGKTVFIKDGSVAVTALVFTLLLPNRMPLPFAVLGVIFGVGIIKHCFGGLGSNWLNPAAGAWLFMRLSWPGVFNQALNFSVLSLPEETVTAGFMDNVFSFLNNTVLTLFRAEIPASYTSLFVSTQPGIIADRGVFALLLGTILITAFRATRSLIPAVWIAVFGFFTFMAGALPSGGGWWNGDILFAFLTGGTMAAAFILAAEPVTSAKSKCGVIVSAIAGGFLAWFFRFPGAEAYGAIISVLVINALLPFIRYIKKYLRMVKGRVS